MGGIYLITCAKNGICYVGATVREYGVRFTEHRTSLKSNKHHNVYLQRAFNKYGLESFEFAPVEDVEDYTKLLSTEIFWIDYLRYIGAEVVNIAEPDDYPVRYRDKIADKAKDRKPPTDEQKRNMSRVTSKKVYPNIVSPDGTVYSTNWLSEFCRIHDLEYSGVRKLLTGNMKSGHYKGWYVEGNRPDEIVLAGSKQPADRVKRRNEGCKKTVTLKNPYGVVYTIKGFHDFAKREGINYTSLWRLIKGEIKQIKGWTLVTEDDLEKVA